MYKPRRETVVIGLTGRTGAGCSTVAEILQTETFDSLHLRDPKTYDFNDTEERKQEIVYKFLKNGNWEKFHVIEGSAVILTFIFERPIEELLDYLDYINNKKICIIQEIDTVKKEIEAMSDMFIEYGNCAIREETIDRCDIDIAYNFYNDQLIKYRTYIKKVLSQHVCYPQNAKGNKAQLYTFLMQTWGNNIRMSGNPYCCTFSQEHYYCIAQRMDLFISVIAKHNQKHNIESLRIAIDAIRNPYEALFFKDKYAVFFLVSISTEESFRKMRLSHLSKSEQVVLEETECPAKFENPSEQFYHQNIQGCIELSDIHLYNPDVNDRLYCFLTSQIVKYVALMLHPGLITPSSMERCMQLAYNAKFNSGCLSRQVGAVVTGDDYSIRAVGWNDVPKGQVPCNLRCIEEYCRNKDIESYSEFELCDEDFENSIKKLQKEINRLREGEHFSPYCFKDVYCGYKGISNQVFTRSLHAEENAFLQISKYGGAGIKGGYLFTTASPCELCAKKAYQLGIKSIYYIDPYPGISIKHVLSFGRTNNPKMNLFYGAIGNAYISLYEPRMAYKDELELITGLNVKKTLKNTGSSGEDIGSDIKLIDMVLSLDYKSKEEICCNRKVQMEVTGNPVGRIDREIIWTGSEYISTKLIKGDGFELIDCCRSVSPYNYSIDFKRNIFKGEKVEYEIKTQVSDKKGEMRQFLSHTVKNPTEKLTLSIRIPKDKVNQVSYQEYYDSGRELPKDKPISLEIKYDNGYIEASHTVSNPNLLHTYCITWGKY